MTSMIERVALALANYDARQVDVPEVVTVEDFRFDSDRQEYLRRARAAIHAMREPTDAMVDNGQDARLEGGGYYDVWYAMIDAALSDDT